MGETTARTGLLPVHGVALSEDSRREWDGSQCEPGVLDHLHENWKSVTNAIEFPSDGVLATWASGLTGAEGGTQMENPATQRVFRGMIGVLLVAVGLATAAHAGAQTLVEFSAEARFQLDLHVPDAALVSMLPE